MKGSSETRKTTLIFASLFWVAAILRFFSVPPFVIDDDEAWWSAASLAMKSPWDFYRSAVDHKPPGIVWFYWLVDHVFTIGGSYTADPRLVRAAYTTITILAAGVLGWMASRFARSTEDRAQSLSRSPGTSLLGRHDRAESSELIGWCAGTLFLLITAIPAPKLLSVTADGLLIDLVIFGYALALFVEFPGVSIVSGVLLGASLLIKQTAVFFAIPILFAVYPRRWSWKQIAGFVLGSALVIVPTIIACDAHEFFYWTWTYPSQVLVSVRERLFDSNSQMVSTLMIFAVATLPALVMVVLRAWRTPMHERFKSLREFRVLWLISGVLATLLGKGLFLHYMLLFAAPFALLAADTLIRDSSEKWRWRTVAWMGLQYVVGCAILLVPASGVFWGTDLGYFSQLSRVMKASLRGGEHVMVWGGSALPLTFSATTHVTRFVLPRFAVEPYATERTRELFHQELAQDPPALILDLHERGDNQFNNPLESEPYIASQLKNYRLYVSETVPWAKFYFLSPPQAGAGLVEVKGESQTKQVYGTFPSEQKSWMTLVERARSGGAQSWRDADWSLRMAAALELLSRQSFNPGAQQGASSLAQEIMTNPLGPELRSRAEAFVQHELGSKDDMPFPLRSMAWWPSVALVELQPKTFH